jgi:hypothetical protein
MESKGIQQNEKGYSVKKKAGQAPLSLAQL